jgi:23S rRNA pseudouridine2457 synthase
MQISITEGKNRQVRRMFAAVGFPVLRLIRTGFEKLSIEDLKPGAVREYDRATFYELLNIGTKGFIKRR